LNFIISNQSIASSFVIFSRRDYPIQCCHYLEKKEKKSLAIKREMEVSERGRGKMGPWGYEVSIPFRA